MRWLSALLVVLVVVVLGAPASAAAPPERILDIDVMSQNLYIGADLDRILQGESPAAVFETVIQTDYPSRAASIAETIGRSRPDLVGLQEATSITLFDSFGNTIFSIDYLQILLGELAAQGYPYAESSVVTNADVTLPLDLSSGLFVKVVDRDAIIHNTDTTSVADAEGGNFGSNFTFDFGGVPVEFTRGYTAVNATVDGRTVRFVNTHLEVQNAPCVTATGLVVCQDVQAAELVDVLRDGVLPTILVGDFNSSPGETAYETIVDGGYVDTWKGTEPGGTCCQAELLDNELSELGERIDHIFVGRLGTIAVSIATTVLGDEPESRTDAGLWSSDHGAPFAELKLITVPESPDGDEDPDDDDDDDDDD